MKASQAARSPYRLLSLGDYLDKQLGERGGGNNVGRELKIYYSSEAATTYILFAVLHRFLTVTQVLLWHSSHSQNSHQSRWVFRAHSNARTRSEYTVVLAYNSPGPSDCL